MSDRTLEFAGVIAEQYETIEQQQATINELRTCLQHCRDFAFEKLDEDGEDSLGLLIVSLVSKHCNIPNEKGGE